jgi:two-component system response regulator HydG
VVFSRYEYLDEDDLPFVIRDGLPDDNAGMAPHTPEGGFSLEDMEKEAILKTLASANGNKSEAARRLGITRKALHKKLKKYGTLNP